MTRDIEEAAAWMLRLRDCRGEPAERRVQDDFERWLQDNPRHAVALRQAEAIFGALEIPAAIVEAREIRVRPRHGRRAAVIAATLLLIAGLAFTLLRVGALISPRADLVTQAGETRTATLPDGSTVTLNTNSALRIDMHDAVRHVSLDRGEAFFDVTPNPARPFTIDAGAGHVQVVGTRFNVRRTVQGAAIVSVLEGRVRLIPPGHTGEILIGAGHTGLLSSGHASADTGPDLSVALAWRDGRAIFYGAPVADVVAEIGRYRAAPVMVANPHIRERTLSGVFNIQHPDAALAIVAQTVDARIVQLPGGALILY